MTHDEYLKMAAGHTLTAVERQQIEEHLDTCTECAAETTQHDVREPRFRNVWWLATAAVLFLALWIWREAAIRVAREQIRSDRAEIAELTSERDVLQQQKEKLLSQMTLISSPGTITVQMTGQQGISGTLFIQPASHRGVLVASGLRENAPGSDYQLWLYGADGVAKSAGTFDVTNGHTTMGVDAVPAGVSRVAVTTEKSGGATQPGPNVVMTGGK